MCQKCATKTNKQKALTPKSLQSCQTCSNLSAARPKFLSTTSLADCRTTGTICASARVSRLRQCCLRFAPTTAKICTRATHARSLARCSGNTNERPTPNRRTRQKTHFCASGCLTEKFSGSANTVLTSAGVSGRSTVAAAAVATAALTVVREQQSEQESRRHTQTKKTNASHTHTRRDTEAKRLNSRV